MLVELTDEQKERLREWWKPQIYDIVETDKYENGELCVVNSADIEIGVIGDGFHDTDYVDKAGCLPLLSIGQCIELLQNEYLFGIDRKDEVAESFWQVSCSESLLQTNELIDALWQAVKAVL